MALYGILTNDVMITFQGIDATVDDIFLMSAFSIGFEVHSFPQATISFHR